VIWVGSTFLFVGFIGPSAAEVGPATGPLLTVAVKKRKVVTVITALGTVTVLAGWVLWLKNMTLYDSLGDWVSPRFGLVLTIGGVLATISAFVGAIGVGVRVERLIDVGNEVAASGGPPSTEQQARIDEISSEIERHGKIDLTLLLLAITAMATARYW
jgi:ribose/xylose/arabinose/galactoside ABC-type transport system permease subunit